jgi:hypothetical protein
MRPLPVFHELPLLYKQRIHFAQFGVGLEAKATRVSSKM